MKDKRWSKKQVYMLYETSFLALLFHAHRIHKKYFNNTEIELATLLSIKTGLCPEDCAYCPQSAHYKTGVQKENLLDIQAILKQAKQAKKNGATRFCMGAAWRAPPAKALPQILETVSAVKALGLETCMTLGLLTPSQAKSLYAAGLDFYNHNLDTSPAYYKKIISTRTYQDRLETLDHVRTAGIKVCCGGILGMGETREDRVDFLRQLAHLPSPPESVPLNRLIPIQGTPLGKMAPIDNIEFIRTIAVARIMMPSSVIRLTAGRETMSEEMQTLCFMAGANSIHFGEKLLTTSNPDTHQDLRMLKKLGLAIKQG